MTKSSEKSRFILGLSLLLVGLFLFTGKIQIQEKTVSASFESEPVELSGFSPEEITEGEKPQRVIIPTLSIDLEVEEASLINGYWEVFEEKAGWGEGSGLPGQVGNQVIFAHAREGLFGTLDEAKIGNKIYVLTENGWYWYEIHQITEVYPGNTEVIEPTDDETLTLYTCSGYRDSKRLIVIAKRV